MPRIMTAARCLIGVIIEEDRQYAQYRSSHVNHSPSITRTAMVPRSQGVGFRALNIFHKELFPSFVQIPRGAQRASSDQIGASSIFHFFSAF